MKVVLILLTLFCGQLLAGKLPIPANARSMPEVREHFDLEELKMRKRFGIGVSAGGPLAIMGVEVDINIMEDFSLSGGIGTGLDYSSFMIKGRYFLMGEWVSPYLGVSLARWWTKGTKATRLAPSVLTSEFLPPGYDYTQGFSIAILSPSVGVQFMHPMGVAFFAELHYMIRMFSLENGTYACAGLHWYF